MRKQATGKFQNSKQQACLPFLLGRLRERTMEERWFSTSEIAAYLGVKPDKVYRLIGSEGLPAHKIGRFWKFRKDEIDAWKGKSTPAGKKGKSKPKPVFPKDRKIRKPLKLFRNLPKELLRTTSQPDRSKKPGKSNCLPFS